MLTSIITVAYNSFRCLERLATSLKETVTSPYEWIIIDSGSQRPETEQLLEYLGESGQADVYREIENVFFTIGSNIGIEKAKGDAILLLNPDCAARESKWLERMRADLERRSVGIVGCVLVDERGVVNHAGGFGRGDHIGEGQMYDPTRSWAKSREHDGFVTGACLMFSRKLLEEIGPLHEDLKHYHSDREFCKRARISGYKVWMSDVVMTHSRGGCQQ